MEIIIKKLQEEIRKLHFVSGNCATNVPYVTAYRFTEKKIQMPRTDNPYLYIILDGTLRLYTPSGIMDYITGQYSVSKIDTPLSGTILTFSEEQDFLALVIEFTANDAITTVLDIDNILMEKIMNQRMEE